MELLSQSFLQEIKNNIIDSLSELVNTVEKDCVTSARYLSKGNACKYADISRPTLQNWIVAGLPVIQIGGCERIDKYDIDLFMVKHKK